MILRRVIEHFRKQEWTAIFLDFVIVVVGVFIGIQVANWNEARVERKAEIGFLAAMKEDVEYSVENLETLIVTMGRQEDARAALYAYSIDPDATLSPQDRDLYISHGLFHVTSLNIRQITFEALKGSGKLGAIGSPALVSALQSLSSKVAVIVRRENDETEVTYLFSDPLLVANVDMTGVFRLPNINGKPAAIGWLPDRDPAPAATPEIMKSLAFRNAVLYRSYFTSARLADVKDVLDQYRRIASLIEERQAELGAAP